MSVEDVIFSLLVLVVGFGVHQVVLRQHERSFEQRLLNRSFAAHMAAALGLIYERKGAFIDHDLRTALIGPDGRLVHIWRSNVWTPYEIRTRIEEVFAAPGITSPVGESQRFPRAVGRAG